MPEKDLLENFTDALMERVPNRKELVYQIADILHIERESAYRRLSGKVHFTIREMGILAKEMNISLDSLLNDSSDKTSILFKMNFASTSTTIDQLVNLLNEFVLSEQKIRGKEAEVGTVVDSLPIEFFGFHPYLAKFMYFKWGRNYTGSKEYENFSAWEVPDRLLKATDNYIACFQKYKSIFYIWDNPIIWNLMNEIKYHRLINVLTTEDVELIKKDLHNLLDDMEEILKGGTKMNPYGIELRFYITNFNISTTAYYILYGNTYLSSVRTTFLQPVVHQDHNTGYKIYRWIHSIKKFSSLISGSGERDRKLFFKEQHQIVDSI